MSVKVLLVEDDAWLAEVEAEMLQSAGFEVRYAPHAQSAIEQIDDRLPDVIVLDMLLTGTTAVALLNELQSHVIRGTSRSFCAATWRVSFRSMTCGRMA